MTALSSKRKITGVHPRLKSGQNPEDRGEPMARKFVKTCINTIYTVPQVK